jgi:hypothetical protein
MQLLVGRAECLFAAIDLLARMRAWCVMRVPSESIVYDIGQIKMRYLIEMKFGTYPPPPSAPLFNQRTDFSACVAVLRCRPDFAPRCAGALFAEYTK